MHRYHYPEATTIRLVLYNYGTHKASSLYETFKPEEAKQIWDRFEFIYKPKHSSWMNMAEIRLLFQMEQSLIRRIDDTKVMKEESEAWQNHCNNKKRRLVGNLKIKQRGLN